MMTSKMLLCLFIINLGTAFGAGIYEMRIVLPMWFRKTAEGNTVDIEAMNTTDVGRKFWVMVTTLPLTLLVIANLVVALKAPEPAHSWWLAACAISLTERLGTFSFFIPTAIKFAKPGAIPAARLSATVSTWLNANYIRNLLAFSAFVTALRTLLLV